MSVNQLQKLQLFKVFPHHYQHLGRSFCYFLAQFWLPGVQRSLVTSEIMELCASEDTFVALRKDGTVVTWQSASLMEMEGLSKVKQVVASRYAFAALKQDGTVNVWGHIRYGGDPCAIRKLREVQELYASSAAFAALRADGSVWTWGDARYGGDGSPLAQQLSDVRRLCRFKRRFFETEE